MNPSYYIMLFCYPACGLKAGIVKCTPNVQKAPRATSPSLSILYFIKEIMKGGLHRPACLIYMLMEMQRISCQGCIPYTSVHPNVFK
jgi:hypothetical protein